MGYAIEFEDCWRAVMEETGEDMREFLVYTVQPGDTFETIAEVLGISVQCLAAANPGVNPATIQAEQDLVSPPTEQARCIFSVVAAKLETTADAIQEANPGVDPTALQVGQIIKLPSDEIEIDLGSVDDVAVDATPADDIAALSFNEPTATVEEMQVDSPNVPEDKSRVDTPAASRKGQPYKKRPPPAELGIAPEDVGVKHSTLQDNCRMQYRDDAGSPWIDIGPGYTPMIDVSKHPEPTNVQQVLINNQDLLLARLCKNKDALTGKEIRLAFIRGPIVHGKKGLWVWPMIVDLLMGEGHKFAYINPTQNKASLDTWAAGLRQGQWNSAILKKVETDEELNADAQRARGAFAQVLIDEDTLVRQLEEVRKKKDKLRWEKEVAEGKANAKREEGDDERLQKKRK
ncbi:MAG: hypothetical protein Q9226_005662 [Calogaya cf. arnoldii]